ncbi:MAG: class I tRNA ligase family protein, partial [Candidatus Aureabacteria bacterium]|nr:class I tRNA ligase family protein [Candidatus Auribacterota bacterium]
VWFDSGISHQAVLAARDDLGCPCAMYLEGSDQHRGWFQTSLLTSVALRGSAPFATVLTHGFITDGEGKKMSKSAGNVIAPQGIIERYGADILRLWVASVDYSVDVRISQEILDHLIDAYRRIRNTFRFLLGNLCDFDPSRDAVPLAAMGELDRWIVSRTQRLLASVTAAFDRYDFCDVYHRIYSFCAVDLSSLYLDMVKDRLYTRAAASRERRSAQTAMARVLDILVRVSAPILAFTAEEVWSMVPYGGGEKGSIHLEPWPAAEQHPLSDALEAEFERMLEIRKAVAKALEEARQSGMIGNALEAEVTIACGSREEHELLAKYEHLLPEFFIVSQVVLRVPSSPGALAVSVANARGVKCPRCWKYATSVGEHKEHPTICGRCVDAVVASGS